MSSSKKRLLIVLGAGSSVEFGIPSVSQLNEIVKNAAERWSRAFDHDDIYLALLRACNMAYRNKTPYGPVNYEMALGVLAQFIDTIRHRANPFFFLFRALELGRINVPRAAYDTSHADIYSELYIHLLGTVSRYMRDACAESLQRYTLDRYKTFIAYLSNYFDIALYTLNYDDLAKRSAPYLFDGFVDGIFDPSAIHQRDSWNTIFHLHGSVHFNINLVEGRDHVIGWNDDYSSSVCHVLITPHEFDQYNLTKTPHAVTIAGGFKSEQVLREPFSTVYARFIRNSHEADSFLFCGYGFGDEHVNRIIRNVSVIRKKKAVIVDWAADDGKNIWNRADAWQFNLQESLMAFNLDFLDGARASRMATISDLKRDAGFEATGDGRVSIWYGGFSEAMYAAELIKDRLE